MRRFIITSPNFNGTVEIDYDGNGLLCNINMLNSSLGPQARLVMKATIPVVVSAIEEAFSTTKATVIETDYAVTFDMFWDAYDKKINRKRCEPIWAKLTKLQQVQATLKISSYNKFLKATGYRTKADPETYLRAEMWENEWK